MNRLALLSVAALGFGCLVPPASAASSSTYAGGCAFQVADTAPPYQALVYSRTVLASTTTGDNPVSATVTCQFRVGSTITGSASFSGTGVVVGQRSIPFTNWGGQTFCTTVDFTSDSTPTRTSCTDQALVNDLVWCPLLGDKVDVEEMGCDEPE